MEKAHMAQNISVGQLYLRKGVSLSAPGTGRMAYTTFVYHQRKFEQLTKLHAVVAVDGAVVPGLFKKNVTALCVIYVFTSAEKMLNQLFNVMMSKGRNAASVQKVLMQAAVDNTNNLTVEQLADVLQARNVVNYPDQEAGISTWKK